MTTQAEFLTRARTRLSESSSRFWTDTEIRQWINEGARDIARKTETLEDRDTIAAIVGTGEYTLGADTIRLHRVEFTPTNEDTNEDTVALEYVDIKDMDNFGWRQRTYSSIYPMIYSVWGSGRALKMIVHPVPATAGNFTVWFYKLPASLAENDLSDAAEHIEIPPSWDDILLDYIEYRAMRKDRDPRWIEAKQMYDENSAMMYDNTRRWVDQGGMVFPSGGGHLPQWLVEG